jgi:hypothetical protein
LPPPISLIDAPRQSTSKRSCARQSTPRISALPRRQILIQIVARISPRLSRYTLKDFLATGGIETRQEITGQRQY